MVRNTIIALALAARLFAGFAGAVEAGRPTEITMEETR